MTERIKPKPRLVRVALDFYAEGAYVDFDRNRITPEFLRWGAQAKADDAMDSITFSAEYPARLAADSNLPDGHSAEAIGRLPLDVIFKLAEAADAMVTATVSVPKAISNSSPDGSAEQNQT